MKVYAVFDCDIWKSKRSMSLIGICDKEHLKDFLEKIKKHHLYSDEDMEKYIYIEEFKINVIDTLNG